VFQKLGLNLNCKIIKTKIGLPEKHPKDTPREYGQEIAKL